MGRVSRLPADRELQKERDQKRLGMTEAKKRIKPGTFGFKSAKYETAKISWTEKFK